MSDIIYHTEATAHGGRAGYVETPDHHLAVQLSVPGELGGSGGVGTNPEQLFAAGYAAWFQSAMGAVARRDKLPEFGTTSVTAKVGLKRDGVGYALETELLITVPGMAREAAEKLVHDAHEVCPYSRATRGNLDVKLTLLDT